MCVSSCRCCVFVSVVHPVAILSAVFCFICSLLIFVYDASGDDMEETYSSMGLVMALYVVMIVSFCFPHVVDVSALSICIVLRAFVVVIYMCLLYVSLGSRVSPSIFGLMFVGSVMLSICSSSCVLYNLYVLKMVMYADDTTLYCNIDSGHTSSTMIYDELKRLAGGLRQTNFH